MVTREKLLIRQKSGRCLGCGSSQHKVNSCPKRKSGFRPPTPRGYGKGRAVRVSSVEDETLPFGREGDDEDSPDLAVDSYMASILSMDPMANFGIESEDETADY
jgi:hypothetical protein